MSDIVERLRERRGVLDNRWPGPTALDLEAASEIERLRAAYLSHLQMENACQRTGKPCRDAEKCGCHLELQEILTQQLKEMP